MAPLCGLYKLVSDFSKGLHAVGEYRLGEEIPGLACHPQIRIALDMLTDYPEHVLVAGYACASHEEGVKLACREASRGYRVITHLLKVPAHEVSQLV